ncbi:hypothetical protein PTSG_02397 [Salpingoeca rosetta]|uniref:OsmC family protein n=1 Tax=Salpingoeca rosetta (strain ATCC 50818 / BSB-021) TaxID=946362 RepID=F2U231_SALR5|nr:uncharacterized protein PTSG_02397 [Salpingoeca rosetta]EGD81683.1 hypothetical protein PTSG_02397 [Salpingoeca rosetta]|eukprot:XP_004996887.1 hypothetical protein PTSG_02397 [Salpingoeca rosetta]
MLRVARFARAAAGVRPAVAAASRLSTTQRTMSAHAREGWIVVEETGASRYQNRISDGRHETLADEPGTFDGGCDTGMNPYGFLLSALGTCTNMTMRMYATRENIPLERSRVFVKHGRTWAKDCDECHSTSGRVDVIEMDVELEGANLTDEHRKKLMKIANSCPVHKTMTTETLVHVNEFKDEAVEQS